MTPPETGKKFRSYVPDKTEMREFTVRAVLLGLVMTIVLGAANLKAFKHTQSTKPTVKGKTQTIRKFPPSPRKLQIRARGLRRECPKIQTIRNHPQPIK